MRSVSLIMLTGLLLAWPAMGRAGVDLDGWTIGGETCEPPNQVICDARARSAHGQPSAHWGDPGCLCFAPSLLELGAPGTDYPDDANGPTFAGGSRAFMVSSQSALDLLHDVAASLRVPVLYAVTLDADLRVSARYRIMQGRPAPRPAKATVAVVVIVQAKTWAKTRVGKPVPAGGSRVGFYPTPLGSKRTLEDATLAGSRASLLKITGATELTLTGEDGRVRFGAPGPAAASPSK